MPRSLLQPSVALATIVLLSCDQQPTQPPASEITTRASERSVVQLSNAAGPQPAASLNQSSSMPEFDPKDFVRGVNNRLFPLRPGTRTIFTGSSDGESERTVVDVTRDKKTILGIEATVVLDRVFHNGVLKEKTFDWYAQDEDGNVWYLGEDSKAFESGGVVSTAGSWEAGKHGAKAGIIMLAHPRVGQTYQQEFAKGVAEDKARVLSLDTDVSVPYGNFDDCLKTEEFTPLEPGVKEVKFFCPRIGFVKGRDVAGGTGRIDLVRIIR
jgi:hypothetical protein